MRKDRTHCARGHLLTPETIRYRSDRPGSKECNVCQTMRLKAFHLRNPLYDVWKTMIRRCVDPRFNDWHLYGGRPGNPVTVCERWSSSYEAFVADMAPRPTKFHTLDRIDNDKGYSPDNCQWATPKQQARKISTNRLIEYCGDTKTLAEWAELAGLKYLTLFQRLNRGWSIEKALSTPKLEQHEIDHKLKRDPVTGRIVAKS